MSTPRYYLKKARIVAAIDQSHLSQAGFAEEIGLSRSHWSQVLNRRRAATPRVRRALLGHKVLRGVPEDELWDVVVAPAQAA
jgi:antitoxin component HigA of HigAB toxin-antitoxin module